VINLDSKGGVGTHWVAARLIGSTLYYADPLGTLLAGFAPSELLSLAKRVITNPITFQRPSSILCGYWAFLFYYALSAMEKELDRSQFADLLLSTAAN
jgi:hypothetical protein